MAILGTPRSFHKKFLFVIEIDNVEVAKFRTCSELSGEVAEVDEWEGGALIPDKSPGRATFADITLERGATQDRNLFDWWKQIINAGAGIGLADPQYKRQVDIVQRDRDGSTLRRWSLFNAWIKKFVAGDWDNTADENVMEAVTMAYDFFDLVQ